MCFLVLIGDVRNHVIYMKLIKHESWKIIGLCLFVLDLFETKALNR